MKQSILTIFIFICSFLSFSQSSGTFTDTRDGKVYKTVKIGKQVWMSENLAFKAVGNCWAYDNDQSNVAKYGYLYNWEAAKTVCPAGWHLPNKDEFKTLCNSFGHSSDEVYKALLPVGSSGFSAQFGGWRTNNGDFYGIDASTYFWSSSTDNAVSAWNMYLSSEDKFANMDEANKKEAYSVRCIKND